MAPRRDVQTRGEGSHAADTLIEEPWLRGPQPNQVVVAGSSWTIDIRQTEIPQ